MKSLDEAMQGPTDTMSCVAAINAAMTQALERDDKVLLFGEDIADPAGGVFKATKGLSTKFGTDRVRATPIAEQGIVGSAMGAAMAGYRTVAEIMFFDFITVAMDQLVNHAAKFRYMSGGVAGIPMVVRTTVGQKRFGAQHSQSLEAWFMHVPGIKVVMPSDPVEFKGLLTASILDDDPTLFVEHINLAFTPKGEVPTDEYAIPLGVARTVRAGETVTIVTYGTQVAVAMDAAATLTESGVEAEVLDLRTLIPMDELAILESVARTGRCVVLHEAARYMGPGAEISSLVHEELFGELEAPVLRLGAAWAPRPFAASLTLNPTADEVAAEVRRLVER